MDINSKTTRRIIFWGTILLSAVLFKNSIINIWWTLGLPFLAFIVTTRMRNKEIENIKYKRRKSSERRFRGK